MVADIGSGGLLDLTQESGKLKNELLQSEIIIWLGTVRPDGRPHIIPVWFLWENNTVLIFSKPDVKIKNLKQNNKVSLGISDHDGEQVVLLEGEATLLDASEVSPTYAPYVEKYAHKLQEMGWTGESMAQSYNQPIRIKINKIK